MRKLILVFTLGILSYGSLVSADITNTKSNVITQLQQLAEQGNDKAQYELGKNIFVDKEFLKISNSPLFGI